MSPLTFFLSRLLGLYYLLAALSMFLHKQTYVETVTALIHNSPVMFVVGIITVIAGAGDGSRAQRLVGRRAGGRCHAHRLDNAGQGPALSAPAAGDGSGIFPQQASLWPALLLLRRNFTSFSASTSPMADSSQLHVRDE